MNIYLFHQPQINNMELSDKDDAYKHETSDKHLFIHYQFDGFISELLGKKIVNYKKLVD